FKIIGQVGLGLIVGLTMMFSPSVVIREHALTASVEVSAGIGDDAEVAEVARVISEGHDVKSTVTTIPFVKDNNFDYAMLTSWMGDYAETGGWILFIVVGFVVVAATANRPH
ncbi:MAG: phospho-N-acetylmuramoyl-pentapeptide-transferase, partial [Muribaculaceae bacterium]|nr:phospho-N-acetylmuramoyl-pentapeptide-transferase [Muribaculaceae bacterium]